ncbi:MAG: pyridoxamine 5'-phosphate oxidase [Gammaproteobacteria bacterium]|jgi:pyridoxamine 5'-phosphate oxidase
MMTIYQQGMAAVIDAYQRALATGQRNMNAMSLATVAANGAPSVRTVLLKAIDESGLVFFTDSRSRKGQDLQANRAASVCFYWEPLEEQVRIDGHVQQVDQRLVAADFSARPRAGQALIWASAQSTPLSSVEQLRAAAAQRHQQHEQDMPVPAHWVGYRLVPNYIETWKGSRDRLHQRIAYAQTDDGWEKQLLHP